MMIMIMAKGIVAQLEGVAGGAAGSQVLQRGVIMLMLIMMMMIMLSYDDDDDRDVQAVTTIVMIKCQLRLRAGDHHFMTTIRLLEV